MLPFVPPRLPSRLRLTRPARYRRAVRSVHPSPAATWELVTDPLAAAICSIMVSRSARLPFQRHGDDTWKKKPRESSCAGGSRRAASSRWASRIPVPQPSISPISLNARAITGLRTTDIPVPRSRASKPSGSAPASGSADVAER